MAMVNGRMVEDVSSVSFCIESVAPGNGRVRFKKDDAGFYIGVPISAIGVSTRNNSYYDVDSFVSHINNPSTLFNMMLKDRQLYGEFGHPILDGLSNDMVIKRLTRIEEPTSSHLFRSVYVDKTNLPSGGKLVLADLMPAPGEYGDRVKASLDNPELNTAFSIRSLTSNTIKNGISYRKMVRLVTADFVLAPGFAEATKGYAHVATESLQNSEVYDFVNISLPKDGSGQAVIDGVSVESFTDGELNEYFGSKKVVTTKRTITLAATRGEGNQFYQPITGNTTVDAFLKGF